MEFLKGFSKHLSIYESYKESEYMVSDDVSPLISLGFDIDEVEKCQGEINKYYYDLLCSIARSDNNILIDIYTLPMLIDVIKKFENLQIYYNYAKLIKIFKIMMRRPLPIDILIYIFTIKDIEFNDSFILISHMVESKMLREECYRVLTNTQLRNRVIGKIK